MDEKSTKIYLKSLVGAVYKVLALFDEQSPELSKYIDSLCIQLIGGLDTFEMLKVETKYITVINTIQYLRTHDFDKKLCKREILKCTNILDKLSKDMEVAYGN